MLHFKVSSSLPNLSNGKSPLNSACLFILKIFLDLNSKNRDTNEMILQVWFSTMHEVQILPRVGLMWIKQKLMVYEDRMF